MDWLKFLNWISNVLFLFFALLAIAWLYLQFARFIGWLLSDRDAEQLAEHGPKIRCNHSCWERTERGAKCLKCSLVIDV